MNNSGRNGARADLEAEAARLHRQREIVAADIARNDAVREGAVLRAARGDATARRPAEQALSRAGFLAAQADALDRAIASAAAAIAAAQAEAEKNCRRQRAEAVLARIEERQRLAGEVERKLRRLLPLVAHLGELGQAIAAASASERGSGHQAPLGAEIFRGRLTEFMAGLGFDSWLPLPRPETRAPLPSLAVAEAALHRSLAEDCRRLIDEVAA